MSSAEPTRTIDCAAAPVVRLEPDDWFALQTRSRWEQKIRSHIEGKGHVAFVPVRKERRRWSDRVQKIEVPMFPGYVFVRAVATPAERLAVLQTSSVYGFVTFGGVIARIPDQQINDLKRIEENSSCSPWPFLKVGQRIRIRGGCLEGLEGIFVAGEAGKKLVISIVPMQRSIAVSIADYDFEVV